MDYTPEAKAASLILKLGEVGFTMSTYIAQMAASYVVAVDDNDYLEFNRLMLEATAEALSLLEDPENIWEGLLPGAPVGQAGGWPEWEIVEPEPKFDRWSYQMKIIINPANNLTKRVVYNSPTIYHEESVLNLYRSAINLISNHCGVCMEEEEEELAVWIKHPEGEDAQYWIMTWDQAIVIQSLYVVSERGLDLSDIFQQIQDEMSTSAEMYMKEHSWFEGDAE